MTKLLTKNQFKRECTENLELLFAKDVDISFDYVSDGYYECNFSSENDAGEITYYISGRYFGAKVGEFLFELDNDYYNLDSSTGKNLREIIIEVLNGTKANREASLNAVNKLLKNMESK